MDNNNKSAMSTGQKALVKETDSGATKNKKYDRRAFLKMTGAAAGTVAAASMLGGLSGTAEAACGGGTMTGTPLDPLSIPKYVNRAGHPAGLRSQCQRGQGRCGQNCTADLAAEKAGRQ